MSLFLYNLARFAGSGTSPGIEEPGEEVSNTKNVRLASFSGEGSYWANGGEFPERSMNAGKQYLFIRKATDHMNGGATHVVEYNIDNDTWGTPVQIHTPTKQTDDVTVTINDDDVILVTTMESDHGVENGGTSWDSDVWLLKFNGTTLAAIGSPVLLTSLITGYVAMQYEWVYSWTTYNGTIYGAFTQMDIDTGTPGQAQFSLIRSTDGGTTFTQHVVHTKAPGGIAQSECLVVPYDTNKLLFFTRLDQGGPWRMWYSINNGSTWTAVGATNLGWQATREKVLRWRGPNSRGLHDFWIMDRDTGWMCVSRDNDPTAPGNGFTNGQFNDLELYYYMPYGSHNGLGYGFGFVKESGVDFIGFSVESPTNDYAEVWYTLDDNVDVLTPPVPVSATESFVTTNSFLITVDPLDFTDAERQRIRWFEWGFYSDSGRTTPIQGEYNYTQASPVDMDDFRAPSHFINGENIQGMSGDPIYGRVRTVNQVGASAWLNFSFTMA